MSETRRDLGYTGLDPLESDDLTKLCKVCHREPVNGVLVSVAPSARRDTCGDCAGKANAERGRR